ncbi:hypothetical protein NX059_004441 [Plenodomus lindquistii]|nr:hypothetical protein NX059_004441 [Plenodomus lindquistii]
MMRTSSLALLCLPVSAMQSKNVSQHEAAEADDNSPSIWCRLSCSADTSHKQSAAPRGSPSARHCRDAVEVNEWTPERLKDGVQINTPDRVIMVQDLYAGNS